MSRRRNRMRLGALLLATVAALGLQLIVGVAPASAANSQISFVTASPVDTAFGGNWNLQLQTRFSPDSTFAIPSDQATVDVYVSGRTEPYATHLPIQPDGSVYVSQAAIAVLPPGEYQVTAQLVPVSGSYVDASQTTTPLVLRIASYAVDASITMDDASVASGTPVLEAALTGEFVDATGAVPAGTWAFTVTSKGKTVLDTEVAQDAGSTDALRYEITEKLDRGTDYDVSAQFTPIDALAAGLEVTQADDVRFHTPGGGIDDPIPYPLWLLIVTVLVPLALAAAVIVLTVRVGSAKPLAAATTAPVLAHAVEPEPETWDPFATAHAEPPAPTQVLPPQPVQPVQPVLPVQPVQQPAPPAPSGDPTFTELLQGVPPQVAQPAPQPASPPPTERLEPEGWSLSQESDVPPDSEELR